MAERLPAVSCMVFLFTGNLLYRTIQLFCISIFETVTRDPERMSRNIGQYCCLCFAVFPLALHELDNSLEYFVVTVPGDFGGNAHRGTR